MVTSVPPRACLDVTTCEIHLRVVGVLDTHLSSLRAMLICLSCLLCANNLAFFVSLHLCTLAYMFMHESECHPYFNLMELWTFDPNLHLSSKDTLFCLITCLFAPVWHVLIACLLARYPSMCFIACLLACFFFLYMYMHGAWTLGARVRPPRHKQKGKDASKKMQAHKGQYLVD